MAQTTTEHVADDQPLGHLFTVPLEVVRQRVISGGKYGGHPRAEQREREKLAARRRPKDSPAKAGRP